jgi:hypothetical protein
MYEVIWDTRQFNNPDDWPEDGKQPFTWSFGDPTGFANHGDYVFGWKNDALQNILDTNCYATSCGGKQQSMDSMNSCSQKVVVNEDIDGCKSCHKVLRHITTNLLTMTFKHLGMTEMPGGHIA